MAAAEFKGLSWHGVLAGHQLHGRKVVRDSGRIVAVQRVMGFKFTLPGRRPAENRRRAAGGRLAVGRRLHLRLPGIEQGP